MNNVQNEESISGGLQQRVEKSKMCFVLPSMAVREEPLGLCVCMLSGNEPGQLEEGPGASLSSEVEA